MRRRESSAASPGMSVFLTFKHEYTGTELTLEELIFRKSVSLLPFIITGNRELAVLGRGPSLVVLSSFCSDGSALFTGWTSLKADHH